ncbi:MAG: glycine cleavage system protein GcvH [Desulfurococcaceae archaeon TW002]
MSGQETIIVKTKLGEYSVPKNLLYTTKDEWVRIEEDIITLGITDYAQKKLKYIVNVELPEVGKKVNVDESVATLESVKAIAEVYTPVEGEVIEVNEELAEKPDLINTDPYGRGWIIKLKSSKINENKLLSPENYADKISKEE